MGTKLGRPRVVWMPPGLRRGSGASWRTICEETGLSKEIVQRAFPSLPKSRNSLAQNHVFCRR